MKYYLFFYLIISFNVSAQTYSVYGNGFKVKYDLHRNDTGINFNAVLFNNSEKEIYYSPKALISHGEYFTGVELGSLYYSFDASHALVYLRKLDARDSVSLITMYDGKKSHSGPVIISFDCFVMNNHDKRTQKKFIGLLKREGKNTYSIHYSDYYYQPYDFFRLDFPPVIIGAESK